MIKDMTYHNYWDNIRKKSDDCTCHTLFVVRQVYVRIFTKKCLLCWVQSFISSKYQNASHDEKDENQKETSQIEQQVDKFAFGNHPVDGAVYTD